ncbi:hypothetical protein GFD17_02520 [Bifidobacterium sp. SMB2]|nr:hypothetical protein [Bifidobacterium sp. SMB2]NEG95645.1 hypothetical protein [Bifidobacterium sp. SMB2]
MNAEIVCSMPRFPASATNLGVAYAHIAAMSRLDNAIWAKQGNDWQQFPCAKPHAHTLKSAKRSAGIRSCNGVSPSWIIAFHRAESREK